MSTSWNPSLFDVFPRRQRPRFPVVVVRIGEYDGMFDRYELVERPNDRTAVRWTCYRAIWPTRPRDFVIKSTWEEFADGTIVIATKSMEHERYPETPTFVRGKMVRRRTTVPS